MLTQFVTDILNYHRLVLHLLSSTDHLYAADVDTSTTEWEKHTDRMKKKNLYRQEKLLKLLAWYCHRITDYPSLTVLRACGPSHRCTLHEELNECGTESEQKDADLARTKDV